jgi:hypothetical protein
MWGLGAIPFGSEQSSQGRISPPSFSDYAPVGTSPHADREGDPRRIRRRTAASGCASGVHPDRGATPQVLFERPIRMASIPNGINTRAIRNGTTEEVVLVAVRTRRTMIAIAGVAR